MAKKVLSQKERIFVSLALVLVFILVVGAIGYVAFQRLAPSPPASVRDFFTDDVERQDYFFIFTVVNLQSSFL